MLIARLLIRLTLRPFGPSAGSGQAGSGQAGSGQAMNGEGQTTMITVLKLKEENSLFKIFIIK